MTRQGAIHHDEPRAETENIPDHFEQLTADQIEINNRGVALGRRILEIKNPSYKEKMCENSEVATLIRLVDNTEPTRNGRVVAVFKNRVELAYNSGKISLEEQDYIQDYFQQAILENEYRAIPPALLDSQSSALPVGDR